MATYYGTLYRENAANTDLFAYTGPYGSRAGETVTVVGGALIPAGIVATTDTITLCPLPIGARLLMYHHWWEDLGGTMTMIAQVGTTDLIAGVTAGTAQLSTAATAIALAELTDTWELTATAEALVNLTFSTATTPTAGARYSFMATYTMGNT